MKKLLLTSLAALGSSLFTLCYAQYGNGNSGSPHGPMTAHEIAASINGSLNQSYYVQNVCGLNYVQATQLTETRTQTISADTWGTGFPTTVNISALPPSGCASIVKAYLYYGCTFTETSAPTTTATITNPALTVATVPSTLCGTTTDNICWVGNGSATYRADVTSLITGSGNYTIDLNGFANANYEVDGVTLLIIYSDPTATYSGSMALYDGDLSNDAGVSEPFTAGSFSACNAANGTAFTLLADVQADVSGGTNTETYNGNTLVFPNNFWNYCNVPVSLTSGQNSLTYDTYTNNTQDCYFIGVAGLYWQNTNCVTCTPSVTTLTLTTTSANATCGNNGSASVSVTGATGPLTYSWSPSGQTTDSIMNLAPGSYYVYVSDGNSCAGDSVTILNLSMVFTTTSTNATCSGNGSATVSVTGGVSPYTYLWSNSATTSSISVPAGAYSVSISDNSGCTLTTSVTVNNASPLTLSTNATNQLLCPPTPATATVTPSGGTPPYTYLWSPGGQTTATATGLGWGTYTVTVSDSAGCSATAPVTISLYYSNLTAYTNESPTTCNLNDGSAYITMYGGKPPYTYLWSPGGMTTETITGLSAGSYTVSVTDSNGCSLTASINITTSAPTFYISASPTNISLGDSSLLSVYSSIPATYQWIPSASVEYPDSATTYATPTVTTTYTCFITSGCGVDTLTVTVNVGCFLTDSIASFPYYCSLEQGSAYVLPSNGVAPYTYLWSPGGQTTQFVSGLSAGVYYVLIHDANGCSEFDSVTVYSVTPSATISASPTHISAGDTTWLSASGNMPGTYSWAPSVNNPTSPYTFATPTVTTTYTCTIINGCDTITDTVTVFVGGCTFTANIYSTHFYCDSAAGTAFVIPSGGNAPYTYLWTPTGQTNQTATGLSPGVYSVVVHDSSGCTFIDSIGVSSASVSFSVSALPMSITPGDSSMLEAFINTGATFLWSPSATITNPTSEYPYCKPSVTTTYTCMAITPCDTLYDTITITVSGCFSVGYSATASMCGLPNATATANPFAGIPPYTYLWAPGGQTTATITGLVNGTYTVTVTDSVGCSQSTPVNIYYAFPSFSVSATPDTISAGDTATLNAYSGNVSVTYLWSNGFTSSSIQVEPTVTTTYTVTMTTPCETDSLTVTVYVDSVLCTNNFVEPICMVTIDTATGYAEVMWGRTNSPPQGGYGWYDVYKDSTLGFESTHTQPLNVLTEFVDPNSAPSAGPVSYELATVDSCGMSALSATNTTIYLTVTSGVNAFILNWTAYIGYTPTKYYIYRGASMGSLTLLDSTLNTVLTYTDSFPPAGSIYLIVAGNPSGPCIPTARIRPHRSSDNIFGSLSNAFNTTPLGVQSIGNTASNLNIYPNPSNGQITLEWSVVSGQSSVRISIYDELGQAVYDNTITQTVGKNTMQLNLESLATGIYTLRMQTTGGSMVKKVVIMKK